MKKILAVVLVCTVSSFATWDYFLVIEKGKGEAKVGVEYFMQDKSSIFGIGAKARFSVIEGLELVLMGAFPMTLSDDGDSCGDILDDDNCPPTYFRPIIGLRYWLPMGIGIALDVNLPLRGDGATYLEDDNLVFIPALQFSTKLTEELELGSQISFSIPLKNDDKFTPPMELGIGLELDYSLGMVTPFVGCDAAIQVTKMKFDGKDDYSPDTAIGFVPYVGVIFTINDMFSADTSIGFGIGEDYYGKEMPIWIAANFFVNF